jgi:hypothetical protein
MSDAYATSPRGKTVRDQSEVLHILVAEPFEIGRINRVIGDTYCQSRRMSSDLSDDGEGTPTCPRCISIADRLEKAAQYNRTKQAVHDAVWEREIDQVSTLEVAEQFGCDPSVVRRILLDVVYGRSGDERFKSDEDRGEGVIISDGSTFNFSPMDVDGSGISFNRRPKHYIWFAS